MAEACESKACVFKFLHVTPVLDNAEAWNLQILATRNHGALKIQILHHETHGANPEIKTPSNSL